MSGRGFVIFYVIHVCYGYRQLIDKRITQVGQSSAFDNYGPYRTIDGYPSLLSMSSRSCSHTGVGESEAWLRIDLRKEYNIKNIKFWYRNDRIDELGSTKRLHGYFLQYNNNNNKWIVCYHDTTPINQTIPMPSTVGCPQKTRYILFYTNTPSPQDGPGVYLEICEIEVYGCDLNQYGENCTECVNRCVNCDIVYGCVRCQYGFTGTRCEDCEPGFSGQNCESCLAGWYGYNCSQSCSENCLDSENCDKVNGSCLSGCVSGYRGDMCSEPCKIGTFGEDCKYNCSGHCYLDEPCDIFNGSCSAGCNVGWSGSMCEKECFQGKYGFKCNNTCNTCKDMICNNFNGSCFVGCSDGWTGELCNEACPDGFFGPDCSRRCGNCENETCNHVNGLCPGNCNEGWKGSKCLQAFSDLTENKTMIPRIVGVSGIVIILGCFILISFRRKSRTKQEYVYDSIQISQMKDQENPYADLNTK